MTVAAFEGGKWHRAEVLYLSGHDAFVMLVDSGGRAYIKMKHLRYLEKSFALPSRKAGKGSLFGVMPKNGEALWGAAAMMQFQMITKGKTLTATIKAKHEGTYELLLVDQTTKRAKVADILVELGLAGVVPNLDCSTNAILVTSKTVSDILTKF